MATSLSEAYIDSHIQHKHIIPLDFQSINDLPESHTWTTTTKPDEQRAFRDQKHEPDDNDTSSTSVNDVPPVIDLTSPDVVDLVGNACEKWGMFQVTNHGVPASLLDDAAAHAQRLFALPAETKLKALRSPRGATGYGVARISPFFAKLMWHEGFTIMGSSAAEHAKLLWPNQYEEFCDAMDNYQKKMKSLAYKILLIILKSLGVDQDQQMVCLSSLYQSEGALQLNSYPSCPNPSRAIGLAPHTDSLLLTILHQNDTNGLQIFREDIGWTSVPPVSDALIVNIGDLMHILSNARFPTVYHRVVPNEMRHRFSMAYFYGPPIDSVVAPLSKIPGFRPVTVKDYIALKNKHLEKAIPLLRI